MGLADRRLLPDMDPLPLGGGLQGPFGWPEGLALPFVARLGARHAGGLAAGLPLCIDADARVQGAGQVEAPSCRALIDDAVPAPPSGPIETPCPAGGSGTPRVPHINT
jgi:hypothetical protein